MTLSPDVSRVTHSVSPDLILAGVACCARANVASLEDFASQISYSLDRSTPKHSVCEGGARYKTERPLWSVRKLNTNSLMYANRAGETNGGLQQFGKYEEMVMAMEEHFAIGDVIAVGSSSQLRYVTCHDSLVCAPFRTQHFSQLPKFRPFLIGSNCYLFILLATSIPHCNSSDMRGTDARAEEWF